MTINSFTAPHFDKQEAFNKQTNLRTHTVVEAKLAFKVVKTTGRCSRPTVHGKLLIVLDFLVTTTSTDTMASRGTRTLWPLSNKSLVNWSLYRVSP